MKTRLLNNLEERLAEVVEREFVSSRHYRERVVELLKGDMEAIQKVMRDENHYDKASWPYYQADKLGELRAIQKLISLLE